MDNKWNRRNTLWMLLYAVLYAVMTALVCVTGAIHPILFVCYQITAGLLLSGLVIRAFARIKAPGTAICLALGMLLLLVIIGDAVPWFPVSVIMDRSGLTVPTPMSVLWRRCLQDMRMAL